jgi:hypothetical protein
MLSCCSGSSLWLSHHTLQWSRIHLLSLLCSSLSFGVWFPARSSSSTGIILVLRYSPFVLDTSMPSYGSPQSKPCLRVVVASSRFGRLESLLGRRAYLHLFVTTRMRRELNFDWNLRLANDTMSVSSLTCNLEARARRFTTVHLPTSDP